MDGKKLPVKKLQKVPLVQARLSTKRMGCGVGIYDEMCASDFFCSDVASLHCQRVGVSAKHAFIVACLSVVFEDSVSHRERNVVVIAQRSETT